MKTFAKYFWQGFKAFWNHKFTIRMWMVPPIGFITAVIHDIMREVMK